MGGNTVSKKFKASKFREIELTEEEKLREINYFNKYFGYLRDNIIPTAKSKSAFFIETSRGKTGLREVWLVDRNRRVVNKYTPSSKNLGNSKIQKLSGKFGFSALLYSNDDLNASYYSKITRKILLKTQIDSSYVTEGKFDGVPVSPKGFLDHIWKIFQAKLSCKIFHERARFSFGFYYHLREEKMFITKVDKKIGTDLSCLGLDIYEELIDNNQVYFLKFFDRNILFAYAKILPFKKIEGMRCSSHGKDTYFFAPILIKKGGYKVICQQVFECPCKMSEYSKEAVYFDKRNSESIGMLVLKMKSLVGIFDFDEKGFFLVLKFKVGGETLDLMKSRNIITVVDVKDRGDTAYCDLRKFEISRERGNKEFLIDEFLGFDVPEEGEEI